MDTQLTETPKEGDPAFPKETENDNSASPSEETNEPETTPSSEEGENQTDSSSQEKPFHEHPRWKKREEEWKDRFNEQEKRHSDELAQIREEIRGSKEREAPIEIPQWFGGDAKQWQEFKAWNEGLLTQAKTAALNEIQSKTEKEQQAIEEANKYFHDQIKEIEYDQSINPDLEKVDRNKLLKFTIDNDLIDSQGRWNYRAAFQLMQAQLQNTKNKKLDEKKKIVSMITSEKKAEAGQRSYKTSEDFQNNQERPW